MKLVCIVVSIQVAALALGVAVGAVVHYLF